MLTLNINTDDLRNCGEQLGFIFAEFCEGFMKGMRDYNEARERVKKDKEAAEEENRAAADADKE